MFDPRSQPTSVTNASAVPDLWEPPGLQWAQGQRPRQKVEDRVSRGLAVKRNSGTRHK